MILVVVVVVVVLVVVVVVAVVVMLILQLIIIIILVMHISPPTAPLRLVRLAQALLCGEPPCHILPPSEIPWGCFGLILQTWKGNIYFTELAALNPKP